MKHTFLIAAFTLIANFTVTASDDHVFVSKAHEFSMQYPKTWTVGEVVHPQTIIRVESPDGDDYNITVVQDDSLTDMSPKAFADGMLKRVDVLVTKILARNYPDVKLIKKGIIQLSQQPAVYYSMDYTLSAAGRDIAMRSFVISTKHKDKQYTLTFRTPVPFFDDFFPTIQRLALGFQFTQTKIGN